MKPTPISLVFVTAIVSGLLKTISSGPASADSLPSYASAEQTIHGRIRSVDGQYHLTVSDDKGYLDHVNLHQGTVINPTGLTLAPGMSVTILGYNGGSVFVANEIDTPYVGGGPPPAAVRYGVGWSYPGSAFGYAYAAPPPIAYGYGPSYGLFVGGGYPAYPYGYRPYYGGYRWYRPHGYGPYYGGYRSYSPHGYGSYYRGYSAYHPSRSYR